MSIIEQAGENDLDKWKELFCTVFADDRTVSVSAAVTYQKYNPEWEEYIELEMDAILADRDKLKVVLISTVMPSDKVSARTT